MQKIYLDDNGTVRFKGNKIVRFLLEAGPYDLNTLSLMNFDNDDWNQFAQLIGYSICGFSDLSYANEDIVDKAYEQMERL